MIINSIIKGAGKVVLDGIYKTAEGVFQTITTAWGWTSNYRWKNVECDGDDLVLKELTGVDFDGSGNAPFGNTGVVSGANDFSLCIKINPNSLPSASYTDSANAPIPLGFLGERAIFFTFADSKPGNVLGLRCQLDSTWQTPVATSALSIGTWYSIVGTYNTSTGFKLYVNGVEVSSSSVTGSISSYTTQTTSIAGYGTRKFNGKVTDVRIYSRTLSLGEAKDYYNNKEISDDNLEAHWKMNEGTGSILEDSSSNKNDATLSASGATWFNDGYFETGERVSTPVLIPAHKNSNIQWEDETDEDTDVKIYTGISDSDEEEPDSYTEATNDDTIENLEKDKHLYCKQVLSTEDTEKTPKLKNLKIEIK